MVGSKIAKELIQQESALMPFLRKQLSRDDITLAIDIDPSKANSENVVKPKKILSVKEKYDKMRDQNPLIEDMRKRFDLKPDYD